MQYPKFKNKLLDGLNSRMDTTKKKVSEFDNISIEIIQSEKQREQRLKQI